MRNRKVLANRHEKKTKEEEESGYYNVISVCVSAAPKQHITRHESEQNAAARGRLILIQPGQWSPVLGVRPHVLNNGVTTQEALSDSARRPPNGWRNIRLTLTASVKRPALVLGQHGCEEQVCASEGVQWTPSSQRLLPEPSRTPTSGTPAVDTPNQTRERLPPAAPVTVCGHR